MLVRMRTNAVTMSRMILAVVLLPLAISSVGVSAQDGTETMEIVFFPPQSAWYTQEKLTLQCLVYKAEVANYDLELLHNNTAIPEATITDISIKLLISNLSIDDSGTYECRSKAKPLNASHFVQMIDTNLISVPANQYAYINVSASLNYTSVYDIESITWVGPNSKEHNGTIEHVTVESEGRHNCTMTIMGAPKDWPVDVFVIEPPTIDQVEPFIIATTTNQSYNVTVSYSGRAPLGGNITLFKDGSLTSWAHFSKDLGSGQTTIVVYEKDDTGNYTLVVETSQHDGAEPPYKLTSQISFFIKVLIPPKIKSFHVEPSQYSCFITWTYPSPPEVNPKAIPSEVNLVLLDFDSELPLREKTLYTSDTFSYEFNNLIPASKYKVTMSVKNDDGQDQLGSLEECITDQAEPSISNFTILRTASSYFNATLSFNYLGADDACVDEVCYSQTPSDPSIDQVCDNTTNERWQRDHLTWRTNFNLSNSASLTSIFSFKVTINNIADKSVETKWINETIVPLGQPSKPSFVSLSSDAVELIILLPTTGSPPILKYEVTFSSDSAPSIVVPVTGVFETGQTVTLSVGGSSSDKQLLSSTDYQVSFQAYNLAGWSLTSPEIQFTTLVHTPLPTPETILSLETWVIVLTSVVASLTCLVLIIATVMFLYLHKRYKKKKNGYPITPAAEGVANKFAVSPGEQRCARQYFSYDVPLTPRPPTAEPQFLNYPFAQIDRLDSDSEGTDTRTPCYKYVVSPTPDEVGVKGFLGSNPGSGTFVYV